MEGANNARARRLYLDTNIHISHWLDEMDGLQYAGYYAQQLKQEAINCRFTFVASRLVESELTEKFPFLKHCWDDEVKQLREIEKLVVVRATEQDLRRARELSAKHEGAGLHPADAIHLVLAERWADIFVTRDRKLKEIAEKYMPVASPEELTRTA